MPNTKPILALDITLSLKDILHYAKVFTLRNKHIHEITVLLKQDRRRPKGTSQGVTYKQIGDVMQVRGHTHQAMINISDQLRRLRGELKHAFEELPFVPNSNVKRTSNCSPSLNLEEAVTPQPLCKCEELTNKVNELKKENLLLQKKYDVLEAGPKPKRINAQVKKLKLTSANLRKTLKPLRRQMLSVNDKLKAMKVNHKSTPKKVALKRKLHSTLSLLKYHQSSKKRESGNAKKLNKTCKRLRMDLDDSMRDNEITETILKDSFDTSSLSTKKDKKMYSFQMRKVMYKCIVDKVPVDAAGGTVAYIVKQLTGRQLEAIPDSTTFRRAARELGILSDLQTASVLLNGENVTIAWDATSVNGDHLNEVHIC